MQITNTPLDQININVRFRKPSEVKVNEIADSISQVGLLSPIGLMHLRILFLECIGSWHIKN